MKKRIIPILLIMVLVITMFTPFSMAASKTKKMTLYDVVKSGKYAYAGTDNAIYKVNIKTGKVRKMKSFGEDTYFGGMRLYKGYLYYLVDDDSLNSNLFRMNVKTGKIKRLVSYSEANIQFAIRKSKIYYMVEDEIGHKYKRVMKLNGKSKRKSSYKVSNSWKKTNSSKYKLYEDKSQYDWESNTGFVDVFLKTPSVVVFLESIDANDYID